MRNQLFWLMYRREKNSKRLKPTINRNPKKKDLADQIKSEKEAQARDEVLDDISERDYYLKKTETVDKSKLPDKGELTAQIKAEKAAAKVDAGHAAVIADIGKEQKLKKVETKEKNLTNLSKEDLIELIKNEREAYKTQEADARKGVLADITSGDKKLKKATTVDKTKRPKKTLAKEIEEEKKANAIDSAHEKVLADVVKDQKLSKAETVDKTKLPSKEELNAQIKSEKQDQKRETAHNQVLENISEGDFHLKHTDTVDKSLSKKSKKELRELIKKEKEAYKAQEKEDRTKVLGDVTKEQKLKKAETVDKSKLPEKEALKAQIKSEKQGQAIDDAHAKVLAEVPKEKKLKKAETKDKSKLADKDELNSQIKSEKQAKKRESAHTKVLGDISERDYSLKKATTTDKSKLASKEELQAQIKSEKEGTDGSS